MLDFQISSASQEDATQIAAIHLAAFDVNPLLHAQFPTPQDLANLKEFLAKDTSEELLDPAKAVLVARTGNGKVVGFAKWTLPDAGDAMLHKDTAWPKGCVRKLLDEYYLKAEEVKTRVLGQDKCYRLAVLATDPMHERQGVGSALLQWGIDRSICDGVLAYLESTIEAAPLYERHGFKPQESFTMTLTLRDEPDQPVQYSETSYVLRPPQQNLR